MIKLVNDDCLNVMKNIPDKSVDMILTDPPYGTTSIVWDNVIPLSLMWEQAKRVTKVGGVMVFFSSQPFTSMLISSNKNMFRHEIVWLKNVPTGMAQASYAPMKYHENILVFCDRQPKTFNKQMQQREGVGKSSYKYEHYCGDNNHVKMKKVKKFYDSELVNPSSVILFNTVPNRKGRVHPTQKPVPLMEYLIKTYTNSGDTVLDFTMGSGTTGVAAVNLGRKFMGIELDETYFNVAKQRIVEAKNEASRKAEENGRQQVV